MMGVPGKWVVMTRLVGREAAELKCIAERYERVMRQMGL